LPLGRQLFYLKKKTPALPMEAKPAQLDGF